MSRNNNNSNNKNTNSSNEWLDYVLKNGAPNGGVAKFWQDVINASLSQKAIIIISEWIKTKYYSNSKDDRAISYQQIVDVIIDEIFDSELLQEERIFIIDNLPFYFGQQKIDFGTELMNCCEQIYYNFTNNISEDENSIQEIKKDINILNAHWENKNFDEKFYQKLSDLEKMVLGRGIIVTQNILIQAFKIMHKFFENPNDFSLQDIQRIDINNIKCDIMISQIIKAITEIDLDQNFEEDLGEFVYVKLDDSNSRLAIDFVFKNKSFNVSTSYKAIEIAKNVYIQNIGNTQLNQIIYNIAKDIKKLADNENRVENLTATTALISLKNNDAIVEKPKDKGKDKVDDSNEENEDFLNSITTRSNVYRSLFSEGNNEEETLQQVMQMSLKFHMKEKKRLNGEGSSSATSDNMKEDIDEEKIAKEPNSLKRKREDEDTEENNKEPTKKTTNFKNLSNWIKYIDEKINAQNFQEYESLFKALKEIINNNNQTNRTNVQNIQDILASEHIILSNEICKQFVEKYLIGWYNNRYLVEENYQIISSENQNNVGEFKMDCVGDGGLPEGVNQ